MSIKFYLLWILLSSALPISAESLKKQAERELQTPKKISSPTQISTFSPATIQVPSPPKILPEASSHFYLSIQHQRIQLSGPLLIKDAPEFFLDDISSRSLISLGGGWTRKNSFIEWGLQTQLGYTQDHFPQTLLEKTSIDNAGYSFYLFTAGPSLAVRFPFLPQSLKLQSRLQLGQAVYIQQATHPRARGTKDWLFGQVQLGFSWNFLKTWSIHTYAAHQRSLSNSVIGMNPINYLVALETSWEL